MKEYSDITLQHSGQVKEPLSAYAVPLQTQGNNADVTAILDNLLHQTNNVKLWVIQKLSESMITTKQEGYNEAQLLARRKKIEAKLDELHITGSLRRLIGAVPATEGDDDDWKKEKEEYLMSKYGE